MNGLNELINGIGRSSVSHDIGRIRRAYEFAAEAHRGEKLKNGRPYIQHLLAVALTLINLGADTDTVAAGLLHDAPGDAYAALSDLYRQHGENVACLVDDVNRLGMILSTYGENGGADSSQKLLAAMSYDVRALKIQLADKLDNMRSIATMYLPVQRKRALETMELYIPIARKIGADVIAEELQNICLNILYPETSTEAACMPYNLIDVYKPTKGLIALPRGSTVIDFAYAAHTELGNRMIGARVNGRLVPLDTELKPSDSVEIITGRPGSTEPSRDWLKIAKTESARKKIRAWFKRKEGGENIVKREKEAQLDE